VVILAVPIATNSLFLQVVVVIVAYVENVVVEVDVVLEVVKI
jgi:hypothetical protein